MKEKMSRIVPALRHVALGVLSAVLVGLVCGLLGTAFHYAVDFADEIRRGHAQVMALLPLGGILIVWMYRRAKVPVSTGTDAVIQAAYHGKDVPLLLSPLIFISTVITHFLGGSAGREGAALQLGGTAALAVGRLIPPLKKERSVLILSGMAALFSALFATPLAAAFFVLEVGKVGAFRQKAFLFCALSSLTAYLLSQGLGVPAACVPLPGDLTITLVSVLQAFALSLAFALAAAGFVAVMHVAHHLMERWFPSPYLRAFTGGCAVLLLILLIGSQDYNGGGMRVILSALQGHAVPYAFLMKLLLTALTLSAGFRGGEIVPSFFVGAALGCTLAGLMGFSPAVGAALGMVGVFAGATKAPIAAVLLGAEMFGFAYLPLMLLSVAVSFSLSGRKSLYHAQEISEV